MTDHPDTDLTDPHGGAEALRKENERLKYERDAAATDVVDFSEIAASVIEEMSKKPGTTWGQVKAAIRALGDIGDRNAHRLTTARAEAAEAALAASRALPAAPVAEALTPQPDAELDALVLRLRTITSSGCNPYSACHEAADAITALARRDAAMRNEGRRQAAEIARADARSETGPILRRRLAGNGTPVAASARRWQAIRTAHRILAALEPEGQ